jgi:putative DNA primase/helicase
VTADKLDTTLSAPALLRHALTLAEQGFSVFPIKPRTKEPATTHGFKDANKDQKVIEQWWRSRPDFNIGVATGAVSNVFVIDIDKGEKELRELEADHGALPPTAESATPRGGRHLFFKYPGWLVARFNQFERI